MTPIEIGTSDTCDATGSLKPSRDVQGCMWICSSGPELWAHSSGWFQICIFNLYEFERVPSVCFYGHIWNLKSICSPKYHTSIYELVFESPEKNHVWKTSQQDWCCRMPDDAEQGHVSQTQDFQDFSIDSTRNPTCRLLVVPHQSHTRETQARTVFDKKSG